MRLLKSECFGRSDTYGLPELVLYLTAILTGHRFSYGTGIVSVTGICDIRYFPCKIIDKWKYADPTRDHYERVTLSHTLSTMYKTGLPIPVP